MTKHKPIRSGRYRFANIPQLCACAVLCMMLGVMSESWAQVCAVPGASGLGTPTGIVNTFFQGNANLSAGATTLTLGLRDGRGATDAIVAGDLLLIIQMQDGTINFTNSVSYGDGSTGSGTTSVLSAGLQEFVKVVTTTGISTGAVVTFTPALTNSYYQANYVAASSGQKRYQVIRVPQYTAATAAGVTAPAWGLSGVGATGETGGVAVIDVRDTLTLGSATVEGQTNRAFFLGGKGFRGAAGIQSTGAGSPNDWATVAPNAHGGKGEGIVGTPRYIVNKTNGWGFQTSNNGTSATQAALTQLDSTVEGYPGGSHARGAPGNAGGGGTDGGTGANNENAGGGGGGGYGAGGFGGRPWNAPLVDSDGRGGTGYASTLAFNRLFLGGGGGSGGTNDGTADTGVYNNQAISCAGGNGICSSGAAGGGIVIIRARLVGGSGVIDVRGAHGYNTGNDAAGGGGGGGSVVIYSIDGGSATVDASGGDGGNAWAGHDVNPTPADRHGPGGGGGAGFVAFSPAAMSITANLNGGTPGITTNGPNDTYSSTGNNGGLATFQTPNTPGVVPGALCATDLHLSKTDGVTSLVSPGLTTYTLTAINLGLLATSGTITVVDVLPVGLTVTAGSVPLSGAQAANWTCSAAAQVITCTSATVIAGNGSSVFAFTAIVSGANGTSLVNKALIGGGGDPNKTTAPTPISTTACSANDNPSGCAIDADTIQAPSLSLSKTDGTVTVLAGGTSTYTLTVANNGAVASSGTIRVVDVLPTGLSYAGVTPFTQAPFTCNYTSASLSFSCDSTTPLAAGANVTISIPVAVATAAPGAVTNLAQVGGGADPNKTTLPTVATTSACPAPVPPATTSFDASSGCAADADSVKHVNLSLTKDDGVAYLLINGQTTYGFTVSNGGDTASVGTINFTDVLPTVGATSMNWPASLTIGGTNAADWTCMRVNAQTVTCSSATAIAAGGNSQFSLIANAGSATNGNQYINKARINGGGDPDLLPAAPTATDVGNCVSNSNPGGCATDLDTATQPTIRLAKSHANPQARSPVDTVPFTLLVSDTGGIVSGGAGTVRVIDVLPAGMSFSGTTPFTSGIFNCSVSAQTISCDNTAVIPALSSTSITFSATLNAGAANVVVNRAQVGTTGADPSNATLPTAVTATACTGNGAPSVGCAVNTIASPSNITLGKGAPATVTTNGSLPYTISLGNSGGTASGTTLTVSDVLPAGVTYVSATIGTNVTSVTCTGTTTLTCTVTLTAAIAANTAIGAAVFTLTTTAPSSAGTIINYASVDPTGGTAPPTPGASCAPAASCGSASTLVKTPPTLGIAKTSNGPWIVGQSGATYTLTVTNSGGQPTSGTITVLDTLPAGISAPASFSSGGWTCTTLGQAVSCTSSAVLAAGGGNSVIVIPIVIDASAVTQVDDDNSPVPYLSHVAPARLVEAGDTMHLLHSLPVAMPDFNNVVHSRCRDLPDPERAAT